MSTRSDRIRSILNGPSTADVTWRRTPDNVVWGGMGAVRTPTAKRLTIARADTAKPLREFAERAALTPAEPVLTRDEAAAEFVEWLDRAYPGAVPAMLEALGVESIIARDGGLGATEEKSLVTKLLDLAQGVLPAYLQYEQQKDVLAIQLQRAQAGLPPLETGQYAPAVQIGLDQETIQRMADEATQRAGALASSPMPWLLLGGGLLAAIVLRKPKRSRRRAAA